MQYFTLEHARAKIWTAQFFSICYVRMWSIPKTDSCADKSILALLSTYHLVTSKLITSQVVQSA